MGHIHSIYDTDPHFKIDPVTRVITNMSETKTCIVQGDHNSERFTFECPRFIDGHDMSTCNQVQVHYINMDQAPREEHYGLYEVEDLDLSPEDENVVIFSWLISENATRYVGPLSFVVNFVCKTGTTIDYAWNTAIHADINVVTGINSGEPIIVEYADIMEAWKRELAAQQIVSMTQTKVGELDGGENVWTATFGNGMTANFVVRNGHAGQTNPAGTNYGSVKSGGDVTIDNGIISVNWPGDDSGIAYSKTVPRGTSGVAEIKMLGGMTRKCTNLFPLGYGSNTQNGISYVVNEDGSITLSGTATANTYIILFNSYSQKHPIPAGDYYISTGSDIYLAVESLNGSALVGTIRTGAGAFTLDYSNYDNIRIYVYVAKGATVNTTVYPMLNEGPTALPFEPYFEGLRSAPVSAVESVGANLFGGESLADKLVSECSAVKDENKGAVTYSASNAHLKSLFEDFKPDTRYTVILKGYNVSSTQAANLAIIYTDGTKDTQSFHFSDGTCVAISAEGKSVQSISGYWNTSDTTLYYNECGVFEGVLTAEDFKPYFKRALEIPEAVRALDGYGEGVSESYYNSVTWGDDKQTYTKKVVRKVFDGTEEWTPNAGAGGYNDRFVGRLPRASVNGVAVSNIYSLQTWATQDMTFYVSGLDICIRDSSCTSAEALKAKLAELYASGNPLVVVYGLAAPEITDISDIIGDNHIEVEEGGTVTMVNEYEYDVPSVVDYSASADVRVIPQSLTASQKKQARANIGIHVVDSVPSDLSAYAIGDIILVTE